MSSHAISRQQTPGAAPQAPGTPESADTPKIGYSYKEAQRITGLGRTTLWKAVDEGRLKCFKVGRRRLFSAEHLSDFMKLYER